MAKYTYNALLGIGLDNTGDGGGGGGATWGSITGTITDQTDLIAYLNGNYIPLSGTTVGNEVTGDIELASAVRLFGGIPGAVLAEHIVTGGPGSYGPEYNNLRSYYIGTGSYSVPQEFSLLSQNSTELQMEARSDAGTEWAKTTIGGYTSSSFINNTITSTLEGISLFHRFQLDGIRYSDNLRIFNDDGSGVNPVSEFKPMNSSPVYAAPWNNLRAYLIGSGDYDTPEQWSLLAQSPTQTYITTRKGDGSSLSATMSITNAVGGSDAAVQVSTTGGLGFGIQTAGTYFGYLKADPLTATRTYQLPDFSGTLALSSSIPFVTPEQYGAVGDGITDDSTAIQNAFNSGYPVYFLSKTYLVSSPIVLTDNMKAFGNGSASIIFTTSNISIFSIQGSGINVENLTFQGNSTGSVQYGISAIAPNTSLTTHYISNRITSCDFKSLGGAGIYGYYIVGPNFEGIFNVVNCKAVGCSVGFWMDDRAEYNNFVNCDAISNGVGLRWKGGNNGWVGGNIVDNSTAGVEILGGANDGHSYISSCKINHNGLNTLASSTYNIYVLGVTKNFIFNCCDIYVGRINVSGAVIKFNACEFSTFARANLNTSTTEFRNCTFYTALDTTNFVKSTGNAPLGSNNIFVAGNTSLWLQNRGTATLTSGTVTINNASITANTKIFLTATEAGTITAPLRVTARVADTSFTVGTGVPTDDVSFVWELEE